MKNKITILSAKLVDKDMIEKMMKPKIKPLSEKMVPRVWGGDEMKNPDKIKQGKKSREAGARFERKVRADLESKGWIVDRWSNQVEFEKDAKEILGADTFYIDKKEQENYSNQCSNLSIEKANTSKFLDPELHKTRIKHPARARNRPIFPLVGKLVKAKSFMGRSRSNGFPDFVVFKLIAGEFYDVHGVEVKMKGKLSKEEKEKCQWLLKNKIFGKIFVVEKSGSEINYKEIKGGNQ